MTFAALPGATVAAILLAVAVGCALQRLCGMGVGLVVAPTLSIVLGPATGVVLTNGTTVVSATVIGLALWRAADWRRLAVILPVAVLGAVPGALVVRAVPTAWLEVIVGATVCLGLVTTWLIARFDRLPVLTGRGSTAAAGVIGAFLNTTAGIAAPAMVVYGALTRWEQRSFAASMQFTFLVMGLLSVATKVALGATPLDSLPDPRVFAAMILTVLIVVALVGKVAHRVPAHQARRLAVALAGTGALVTLGRGVVHLLG